MLNVTRSYHFYLVCNILYDVYNVSIKKGDLILE